MPTYDYQCTECEYEFEDYRLIAERYAPESEPCPNCGKPTVKFAIQGAPSFLDPPTIGIRKPDSNFRNLMGQIKKKTGGKGNIDRYT